jgi:hypothetical protein
MNKFETWLSETSFYQHFDLPSDFTREELLEVKNHLYTQVEGTLEGLQSEVYGAMQDDPENCDGNWDDLEYWINDLKVERSNALKVQKALEKLPEITPEKTGKPPESQIEL